LNLFFGGLVSVPEPDELALRDPDMTRKNKLANFIFIVLLQLKLISKSKKNIPTINDVTAVCSTH